jgi:hypothetical protein
VVEQPLHYSQIFTHGKAVQEVVSKLGSGKKAAGATYGKSDARRDRVQPLQTREAAHALSNIAFNHNSWPAQ